MRIMLVALTVLCSACASTPKPAQPRAAAQEKKVICTGGAMALLAITKPWALKDCVSGESD